MNSSLQLSTKSCCNTGDDPEENVNHGLFINSLCHWSQLCESRNHLLKRNLPQFYFLHVAVLGWHL